MTLFTWQAFWMQRFVACWRLCVRHRFFVNHMTQRFTKSWCHQVLQESMR